MNNCIIKTAHYILIVDSCVSFCPQFPIGDAQTHVACVLFSDSASVQWSLTTHSDIDSLKEAVLQLQPSGYEDSNATAGLMKAEVVLADSRPQAVKVCWRFMILPTSTLL